MNRTVIFRLLSEERDRQLETWGEQHHAPAKWMMILVEELGELADAALNLQFGLARKELIQAGAVIIAWMEDVL